MMLKLRRLIEIEQGKASPDCYLQAARQEAPVRGKARACEPCPLRIGGEWEAGATKALAEMTEAERDRMKRWGCHADNRPCAGMQRLLKAVS